MKQCRAITLNFHGYARPLAAIERQPFATQLDESVAVATHLERCR